MPPHRTQDSASVVVSYPPTTVYVGLLEFALLYVNKEVFPKNYLEMVKFFFSKFYFALSATFFQFYGNSPTLTLNF